MFRIEFDPHADCLAIHIAGFWQPEDVARFSDALDMAGRKARAASPGYSVIIHSGSFPVQANDVADLLTGVMVRTIDLSGGNVGIVVASLLNKMQVERTLIHPRVRPFMTEAEAQCWAATPPIAEKRRAVG